MQSQLQSGAQVPKAQHSAVFRDSSSKALREVQMKKRTVIVENHPENSFMTLKSMRISLPAEPWHRGEDDKKPKLPEEKPRD